MRVLNFNRNVVKMARIAGVNLPTQKRLEIALRYLYGVGPSNSKIICEATGLSPDKRVKDLTELEAIKLREYIDDNYVIEGELRREVASNIKQKMDLGLLPSFFIFLLKCLLQLNGFPKCFDLNGLIAGGKA